MRIITNTDPQMKLGEVDIGRIKFDLRCRDEIPKILIGFQYIYTTPKLREEIFKVLEKMIPEKIDMNNGRPGMQLWQILVLGSLRLNCKWNFDKLQDIANNHITIRQMLGISKLEDHVKFPLTTLKDNISLVTPEVLDGINEIVVKYAHSDLLKKEDQNIRAHCDSFVVKTNVHYPTDINLLNDAMRKVISLIGELCSLRGIDGWRQGKHLVRSIKKAMHHIQNMKRVNRGKKNKNQKDQNEKELKIAHNEYTVLCARLLSRAKEKIVVLSSFKLTKSEEKRLISLDDYIKDVERQIDQIQRRVLNGEVISPAEKVFSIFERHTEWIVKGKAGISQELGVKVCIMKDQYGLILNHKVMQNLQDADVSVSFTAETKSKFPNLKSCGYDKGFYSAENYTKLCEILDFVIMPKKGKLNSFEKERETSKEFIAERRKHSAVESSIAALQNHGLDLCPDKKIIGFKRYVSLAVLSRNVQIIGHIIQKKKLRDMLREERKLRIFAQAA